MEKIAKVKKAGNKGTREQGTRGLIGQETRRSARRKTTIDPGKLVRRDFFEDSPERVSPRLLGKLLALKTSHGILAGRIVEVEAYLGPHNLNPDPAAHSHRGPTPRNQVLFGPAGHSYVYAIYGRYYCMNITCEVKGLAGCVLLRALDPVAGIRQMAANRGVMAEGLSQRELSRQLTSGPSRLCQAMGLTRALHNGLDLTRADSPLQIRDDGFRVPEAMVTVRIGISQAVELPLRFAIPDHSAVSGPRSLIGKRIVFQ